MREKESERTCEPKYKDVTEPTILGQTNQVENFKIYDDKLTTDMVHLCVSTRASRLCSTFLSLWFLLVLSPPLPSSQNREKKKCKL